MEEYRLLRPEEREKAYKVIGTVFGFDDSSIGAPGGHRDPYRDQDHLFGYLIDNEVVSVVHMMRRTACVPGGQWTYGAIAGVSTLQEHRGKGYSSHLMRLAGEQMHIDGVDFGLLLTGINPYYEKFGWFTVPKRTISVVVENPPTPRLDIATHADWREVALVYEAFNKDRPYAVVRTPEYWEGWACVWLRNAKWILVRDAFGLIAYAALRVLPEHIHVAEVGWLPDRPEGAESLAHELAAATGVLGNDRLYGALPDEPELWNHFKQPGITVTRSTSTSLMALPVKRSLEELHAHDSLFDKGSGTGVFWAADDF